MVGYYIKLADAIALAFGTYDVNGAATDADSTPVVTIYDNGSAMAYSPSVAKKSTGLYEVTINVTTGNLFTVGHRYSVAVTWAVGGKTTSDGIGSFAVSNRQVDDVLYPGYTIYGTITFEQLQRLISDSNAGRTDGFDGVLPATIHIKSQDGTKTRATITADNTGRTAVTIGDLT